MPDALNVAASLISSGVSSSGNWVVFAYVDPGTGSYLLQVALAGLLGAGYAIRHFWTGVRGLFQRQPVLRDQELSASPTAAAADTRTTHRDDARR